MSILTLVLVTAFQGAAAVQSAPVSDAIAAIDEIALKALQDHNIVGMSLGVAWRDSIIHARGYGYANLEHQVPAQADTVYRIGSVTKQFTAAAILQLVERSKLSLDDDLREFFPDYPTHDRVVTIRHLLNHTSGIRSVTRIPHAMRPRALDVTAEQMRNWMSREPFDFEPGEQFLYNNSGYLLLGWIIERVTGKSYSEYLDSEVFQPLGLANTYYDSHARVIPNRAQGYTRKGSAFVNAEVNSPSRPYSSGALLSTVLDLISWQRALFSGEVISAKMLETMTTPQRLNSGDVSRYGFGVRILDSPAGRKIAHGGSIIGYRAFLSHYPDDGLIIAILANTQGNLPLPRIESRMAKLLLEDD